MSIYQSLPKEVLGRWLALSAKWRKANPYCVDCLRRGHRVRADVTDHIIPHKGNVELLFDVNNW